MIGKNGRPSRVYPSIRKSLIILIILTAIGVMPAGIGRAVVYISGFIAVPGESRVTIRWNVDALAPFAGFFVWRNTDETGTFTRLNPTIIPLEPGDFLGSTDYSYTDDSVTNGILYWYQLEVINNDQTSDFEEPICAVPGQTSTDCPDFLTPTTSAPVLPSVTFTLTATATATQKTATVTTSPAATATRTLPLSSPQNTSRSRRATVTPTSTATRNTSAGLPTITRPAIIPTAPAGAALTPSPEFLDTSIPLPVSALTGTTTLASLPTIHLIFPTPLEESPAMPAAAGALVLETTPQPAETAGGMEVAAPGRLLFIGLVVLMWLALGAWYIFLFRRIG